MGKSQNVITDAKKLYTVYEFTEYDDELQATDLYDSHGQFFENLKYAEAITAIKHEYTSVRKEVISCTGDEKNSVEDIIAHCVEAAKRGDHFAFAAYYLSLKAPDELFGQEFRVLRKSYAKELKKSGKKSIFTIFNKSAWMSVDVEWDCDDALTEISATNISNWENGKFHMDRETLVQIAFYLGLSREKVNELLMDNGEPGLYMLNISDAIIGFYLDFFENDKEKSGIEKIKHVKEKLNIYMKKAFDHSRYSFVSKDKEGYRLPMFADKILVYQSDLGKWNIEDEIEGLGNRIGEDVDIQKYSHNLTIYVSNKLDYENCKNEQDFFRNLNATLDMFTLYRYGLLCQLLQYLKAGDWIQKKLEYRKINLRLDDSNTTYVSLMTELGLNSFNYEEKNTEYKNTKYKNIEHGNSLDSEDKINQDILNHNKRLLRKKWENVNPIEEMYRDSEVQLSRRTDIISLMLYGRSNYNDGHKGWEYRLSNIKEIIEFLILTGNESDCENFLKDNGYMYDSEKNCVNPYIVLVKYAMAYRDALIDKWIENAAASGLSTETRVQLMRQFPFVQLLEQISRDIMFAGYYGENHTSDKEMKTLLKNMVNPIVSSGRWYIESYEKVTGSYEKFCNEADDWAEEWAEDSEYTDEKQL